MARRFAPSRRAWLALGVGALFFGAVAVGGTEGIQGIDKFYRVDERVATGAQPTVSQIGALAAEGFHTIVNLREPAEFDAAAEESAARELGLRYIHIPVRTADPKTEQLEAFLRATDDPAIYPVFFHCGSGNRVGAFWMVRRVLADHWNVDEAEKEAIRIGMKSPNLKEFALGYIRTHSNSAGR
jgi:uncharacterized protein (TIGR01244 family)